MEWKCPWANETPRWRRVTHKDILIPGKLCQALSWTRISSHTCHEINTWVIWLSFKKRLNIQWRKIIICWVRLLIVCIVCSLPCTIYLDYTEIQIEKTKTRETKICWISLHGQWNECDLLRSIRCNAVGWDRCSIYFVHASASSHQNRCISNPFC